LKSCNISGCSREHGPGKKIKKWVKAGGLLFTEDWLLVELIEPMWPKMVRPNATLTAGPVRISANRGQSSHPLLRGVFVPPLDLEGYDFGDEDDFLDDDERAEAEEDFKKNYDPDSEDDPGDEVDDGHTGVDPENAPPPEDLEDPDIQKVKHTWVIDNESKSIKVLSKKVTTLISSSELKKKCGDRAVAVTFGYGKGRVLHVLSHFGHQQSVQDEATIENLLVNWLMEIRIRIK
jgi:hypothetical protein